MHQAMDDIGRVLVIPLLEGKVYHFNVIYNHAKSHLSVTEDTKLSLKFVEWLVTSVESLGFVNSYYHDRDTVPGRHLFLELQRVVSGSYFTIIVLTPGFVKDCWPGYLKMTAFRNLIKMSGKHQTSQLVVLAVGLKSEQLPREIPAERIHFFFDTEGWQSGPWRELELMFLQNYPIAVESYDEQKSSLYGR